MDRQEIEQLKEIILEIDPCIVFDKENEDKLIGYAERFGCHIIPLYEGVNTFFTKNHEDALIKAKEVSNFPVCKFDGDALDNSTVGYVILENGAAAILHDKELYLQNLAKEYAEQDQEDGEEPDEDYDHYTQALEWYGYNVIGTGLSNATTPAFACTEEFPLPVTLNS